MEIIHLVLGKANPERMNGVNKVVYQLASQQSATWRYVEVWGITNDLLHNYGARNFRTQLFLKNRNPLVVSEALKKAISKTSVNTIFHIHGGWIPQFYGIVKYLKKLDRTVVLTPHGAYNKIAMKKNRIAKKIYFKLFEKPMLKKLNKIHCIGQSEKDGLQAIFKNEKQILVPYGFESPKLQVKIEKKQNDEFIIGFVGRIDMYTKGLDLLLNAFSMFQYPGKLWIIGDGEDLPKLKELAKTLNMTERIVFWGSQYGEEKNKLIQGMDIFVHSSRNEGLPTAVLEAASFGVPSVVSQATNISDLVTTCNAGIAIANENIIELHNAFEQLYTTWNHGGLQSLSENAIHMIENEFSWSSIVDQFDSIYGVSTT